nr:LysM domain-containing protein [Campylobacter massiliensis]
MYKVKSGDTLSTIAQKNGMATKGLLKLNTWLADEVRVSFLQNKVSVESNILKINEIDHVLTGDRNAENILIDANGGDDTLVGDNKKDILKGGEGFDAYYAGDKDIITDSDGKGEVYFDKTKLVGGVYDKEKKVYLSDDKSIEYKLSGDKLALSKGSKPLAINKFTNSKKILTLAAMKHSKNIQRAIIQWATTVKIRIQQQRLRCNTNKDETIKYL